MTFLRYPLLIILGWICYIIIGAILGTIFQTQKSPIRGFISGVINPSLTVFIIGKLNMEKNTNNTYDILSIIIVLSPLILINIQALYNSGLQDGKGDNILPVTGINMKINKGLVFGTLLGSILALILFTKYQV